MATAAFDPFNLPDEPDEVARDPFAIDPFAEDGQMPALRAGVQAQAQPAAPDPYAAMAPTAGRTSTPPAASTATPDAFAPDATATAAAATTSAARAYDDVPDPFAEGDAAEAPTAPTAAPAPAPTTAPAPTASTGTSYGIPAWDRIAQFFRSVGVTPTTGLVSQWGTNIDESYLREIEAKIRQVYGSGAGAGASTGAGAPPSTGSGWTAPTFSGNRMDDAYINAYLDRWGGQQGAEGSVMGDRAYWVRRIKETGGLGPDNLSYWESRAMGNHPQHGTGTGTSAGGGTAAGTVPTSGLSQAMEAAILQLLKEGNTPLDPNDPTLMAQFLPVRNALERNAQYSRAQAAQRAAVQGGNVAGSGGSLEGEYNSIQEGVGDQQGRLMSQLVTNELQARRQKVVQAIGFAQGQQRLALQAYLAEIDRNLRQQALNNQQYQWETEFSYGGEQDAYGANQQGYGGGN